MLVNSVIIVLREVLEAALMISVLLAVSRLLQLRISWLWAGLGLGFVGAVIYGYSIDPISGWFDGVGQEVVNALLQFGVFVVLAATVFLVSRESDSTAGSGKILPSAMAGAIVLAVTREGSEILIFVSGFLQMNDFVSSVGIGSLAGAAIGYSVGVLFYYFLISLDGRHALRISLILLTLVAAGMISQATGLLIQADWISVSGPLWNSSGLVAEDSLLGQLLYALIGYEATPSVVEVLMYASSIVFMAAAIVAGTKVFPRQAGQVH